MINIKKNDEEIYDEKSKEIWLEVIKLWYDNLLEIKSFSDFIPIIEKYQSLKPLLTVARKNAATHNKKIENVLAYYLAKILDIVDGVDKMTLDLLGSYLDEDVKQELTQKINSIPFTKKVTRGIKCFLWGTYALATGKFK